MKNKDLYRNKNNSSPVEWIVRAGLTIIRWGKKGKKK